MAGNIDFNALKSRAIKSGVDEEAVTVNTRALIDKVLARYSGEWTVLRELLQNAADASATTVTIKLETTPSTTVPAPQSDNQTASIKHTIAHHTVKSLVLNNDGVPFTPNDWARLKRIAEGNPDETKIGAFGVGFYSVFSDCEEPFVSSGKEAMAFYWKENSLFTRRLQLQGNDCSRDTTFVLEYRNTTSPVPALLPLCQFLASSITFIGLQSIELWLDKWNILKLVKKIAPGAVIGIPKDVQARTTEGLMTVKEVMREVAQIDARWMPAVEWKSPSNSSRFEGTRGEDNTPSLRSFFSRLTRAAGGKPADNTATSDTSFGTKLPENLTSFTTSSVFIHINTANVRTSVNRAFGDELLRATKKPAPKTTSLAVLTSSYASAAATNGSERPAAKSIFATILPSGSGKIYIGFPTHQTTGLNAHISAPSIIPTVERESIDLNAQWVRTWNKELLCAAGITCRIAWAAEMASLKERISSTLSQVGHSSPRPEDVAAIIPEAAHIVNQFVFRQSTPATQVGQIIENSFWTCSQNAYLEILSSCGVLPSHRIRLAPKDLSFMDSIPVVPEALMSQAKDFIGRLVDFGLITEITVTDIKKELESRPLSAKQLREFLSWLIGRATSGEFDRATVKILLSVVVANDESDGVPCGLLVLKDITGYLNPSRIPSEFPLSHSIMPFKYTKSFQPKQLAALGWHELQIENWLCWLVNSDTKSSLPPNQCITRSDTFSTRVLTALSKQWDSLSPSSKSTVSSLLQQHTVIPTKMGMKKPSETYFPSVRLFDDLPLVTGLGNAKEKFLVSLGVRKTVDLNVIFDRLLNKGVDNPKDKATSPQWSHVELIKYLASVRNDIPSSDITKLKHVRFCTVETNEASASPKALYRVCEIFEPRQSLRELGLPLLFWPGQYPLGSAEAQFLSLLGLKNHPSAPELIHLLAQAASEKNIALRNNLLNYFISNHVSNGYANFDYSTITTPFLPLQDGTYGNPSLCFTDNGASLFGFKLLRKDLEPHASKFGVKTHPPITICVERLIREPPSSTERARKLFKYFSGRLADLTSSMTSGIGRTPIVPVNRKQTDQPDTKGTEPVLTYIAPQECYLGESEDYAGIFDFVDFGTEANLFLLACGSKREPTPTELAKILVKDSSRIITQLQQPEKYLKLLRTIADNIEHIRRDKNLLKSMKTAPFLLASKELPTKTGGGDIDLLNDEDISSIKEWHLVRAMDAMVVDDYASFNLFKESIYAAPQEETLEAFYSQLGTQNLSKSVEENVRIGSASPDQRTATKLQERIHERTQIFLHDLSNDSIKRDAKWLKSHLAVLTVQSISLRRSLRGHNSGHVENRHAIVSQSKSSANPVLYISPGNINFHQVSQALVHILLLRPKLHSTLTLEMLLKTDLFELRVRGYNVERILRQKEAAAKIAETQRQQQKEEDQRKLVEVEQERQRRHGEHANETQVQQPMPGVFPEPNQTESSPRPPPDTEKGVGSFFSDLGRRFGLEDFIRNPNTTHANTTSEAPPPPYTPDPNFQASPDVLKKNLTAAISKCKPHGHAPIKSSAQVTQIAEAQTYCDQWDAHDLIHVTNVAEIGLRFFWPRLDGDHAIFYQKHEAALKLFGHILADCASIFGIRMDSVSIFCEGNGKTIAFNHGGSLFFNFHFFKQLHWADVQRGVRADALVYWWTVFCHELAHNIVSAHSAEHGYYTESFVMQYFSGVTRKLLSYQNNS